MGTNYVDDAYMVTEECCSCGMMFAMTQDFQKRRINDQNSFYCPAGHQQHYTGKSEAQKLKDKLERKERQLEQEQNRIQQLEQQKHRVAAQNRRIRKRIKNGVCPCCNRSFENLANHMKTKHPDFAEDKQLKTLRLAYGLTQADFSEECGVQACYVSNFENGRHVPQWARENIEWWIQQQAG